MLNEAAEKELADISQRIAAKVPYTQVVSCRDNILWANFQRTKQLGVDATFLFTQDYPLEPIITQLKSKTLPETLLTGLTKLMDDNAKKLLGQYQVVPQLSFLSTYLTDNLFCCCYEEFQRIKKDICSDHIELKAKLKSGQAVFKVRHRGHFSDVKISVPVDYPEESVIVDVESFRSSLPDYLTSVVIKQAVEEARKCVEPPLHVKKQNTPFEKKPSFFRVAKFILLDNLLMFKRIDCKLCNKPAFPDKPEDIRTHMRDPLYVERVYCGHIFHFGCLHVLINTPPFNENKKCPVCNSTIYHERWKETPQVLADRWAHKQAKQRELEEVIDFLS